MFTRSDREPRFRGLLYAWLVGAILTVCGVVPTAALAGERGSRDRDGSPKIDRVDFSGTPANPKITLYGDEFENWPAANPGGGTSNLGKCGPITGKTGNDFGSQLWVSDQTQLWSAGYTPYVDCMGLVVVQYSEDKIVLRLGSFYAINYGQRNGFAHGIYKLTPGDTFQVNVEGASATVRVHYGDDEWGDDDWGDGGSPWEG